MVHEGEDKARGSGISGRSCQELSLEGAGEGRRPPALGPLMAELVGTEGRRSHRHGEPAWWDMQGKVRQRAGGQLLESASKTAYCSWTLKEKR